MDEAFPKEAFANLASFVSNTVPPRGLSKAEWSCILAALRLASAPPETAGDWVRVPRALLDTVRTIRDRAASAEAEGYRSKERQYVLDMLKPFDLASPSPEPKEGEREPWGYLCNGRGDGWEERNKIVRDPETIMQYLTSPYWTIEPLYLGSPPSSPAPEVKPVGNVANMGTARHLVDSWGFDPDDEDAVMTADISEALTSAIDAAVSAERERIKGEIRGKIKASEAAAERSDQSDRVFYHGERAGLREALAIIERAP